MQSFSTVQCTILGEEMDGEAVLGAFGCQTGPDCLKDILPTYGQRIKVYHAIKSAMSTVPLPEVFRQQCWLIANFMYYV